MTNYSLIELLITLSCEVNNADKKLETRILKLEKLFIKNEEVIDPATQAVYDAASEVKRACQSLAVILKSANNINIIEVENALSLCEDDLPQMWIDRYNRILKRK